MEQIEAVESEDGYHGSLGELGTCLMVGPHYVGERKNISERMHFVEVCEEAFDERKIGKCIVDLFWRTSDGKLTPI